MVRCRDSIVSVWNGRPVQDGFVVPRQNEVRNDLIEGDTFRRAAGVVPLDAPQVVDDVAARKDEEPFIAKWNKAAACGIMANIEAESNFNPTATSRGGSYGRWAMYKNGVVDTSYTGIAKNQYGWWKCTNGKVMFNETGVFENDYGLWYVVNSKVDFSYNGQVMSDDVLYDIVNGRATPAVV